MTPGVKINFDTKSYPSIFSILYWSNAKINLRKAVAWGQFALLWSYITRFNGSTIFSLVGDLELDGVVGRGDAADQDAIDGRGWMFEGVENIARATLWRVIQSSSETWPLNLNYVYCGILTVLFRFNYLLFIQCLVWWGIASQNESCRRIW